MLCFGILCLRGLWVLEVLGLMFICRGFGVLGLGFLDGLFWGKPKTALEPIALFIPSIIVIN